MTMRQYVRIITYKGACLLLLPFILFFLVKHTFVDTQAENQREIAFFLQKYEIQKKTHTHTHTEHTKWAQMHPQLAVHKCKQISLQAVAYCKLHCKIHSL